MSTPPAPSARGDLSVLERLKASLAGRYAVEGEIGRGGMATVYRARDLRHNRDVAIKVLPPDIATAIAAERFMFEISTAANLLHPHILGLIDSGDADGVLYYIMPHVRGESLRDKLEREKRLSPEDAARITRDVASALTYAHERGIIHRDIKPENILLADGAHVLVADFGLARAILRSADRKFTRSQNLVGTPLYMSPEQASGEESLDGRSDVYSLGCMLFEMLAGHPPFRAFDDYVLIMKHIGAPPPRLSGRKSPVPVRVERVVHRALEKKPARRYETAAAMSEDLDAAIGGRRSSGSGRLLFPGQSRIAVWSGLGLAATVVVALVLSAPFATPMRERIRSLWSTPLSETQFVVLPFSRGSDLPRDGRIELRLHDAIERWDGVGVVDQTAVFLSDTSSLEAGDAQRLAVSFGAGRYIMGSVAAIGDSIRLQASIYDTKTGVRLDQHIIRIARSDADANEAYEHLADALLFRISPAEASKDPGTRSYAGRKAFLEGSRAIAAWDLKAADSAFSHAVASDQSYAPANLWLAQVRNWSSEDVKQSRSRVLTALNGRNHLTAREQALGSALLAMADGAYPEACRLYSQLRQADAQDFVAAYGGGDCVEHDAAVIPDPDSPSRWRFRASRAAGIRSYRDAFEINPTIHKGFRAQSYARLRRILITTTNSRPPGRAVPPDNTEFEGTPSWAGDSIAIIPFPKSRPFDSVQRIVNRTTGEAVRHQRAVFRDIAAGWRRALPQEAEPLVAMAVALELDADYSALDTLRKARKLAVDDGDRIRLAAQEVELRIKFGLPRDSARLDSARALADSLLLQNRDGDRATLELLAGLAVLTGRGRTAAELTRRGAVTERGLPPHVIATSRELLAYAALGGPPDTIAQLEQRLGTQVRGVVEPSSYADNINGLLERAAPLAFPARRLANANLLAGRRSPLIDAQEAMTAGDSARARAILEEMEKVREARRPADLTLDVTYPAAWTVAALGDGPGAIRWLAPVLEASANYPPQRLSDIANAGGLIRGMMLLAELAEGAGDTATAKRWRTPVRILWRNADPTYRAFIAGKHTVTYRVPPAPQR